MWGSLSDERAGLSCTAVISSNIVTCVYNSTCRHFIYSVVESPVPCGFIQFTILYGTLICTYVLGQC
jgi:hypothetical protein